MLISRAYAAADDMNANLADLADAPTAMEAFIMNMGLVVILVALFYLLLIMPQQRRFKEHTDMLSKLQKGDRIVTGGGLVGKVEKIIDDKEVLIDLGSGVKVTALRSMIQSKTDLKPVANDSKPAAKSKKSSTKDKPAKAKSASTKVRKKFRSFNDTNVPRENIPYSCRVFLRHFL